MALGLALLAVALILWIGVRGLVAKGELEAAIPLADTVKASLLANKPEQAASDLATLRGHTSLAVSLTSDVVWRAAELVPVIGSNLSAFRQAAAIVNTVSADGLEPVVELAGTIDISSFKPVDGQVNLDPLLKAQDSVATADDIVAEQLAATREINLTFTLGPVNEAVGQLEGVLSDASETLGSVRTAVNLLPGMLGVDGPRNYLLIFQNNAETRTLGGNPASLALIHVDDGRVDLVQQASSVDLSSGIPAMDLPPETLNLYANNLSPGAITGYVQNITMIPDFPTTAMLAKAMWERKFGSTVDAVISFDPVALSYLIGATGDIQLSTGDVLTQDTVVPLLLSEVYARYTEPADQDAFFAEAAKAVFDLVKSGKGDSKTLLDAMARAVNERRLMVWSSVESERAVIDTTAFSGVLPLTNEPATVVGVYFNDFTTTKMNYYMDAAVDVAAPTCKPDGFSTVSTVTLTSTAPADSDTSLPAFVLGGSDHGEMYVDAVVLGPIGASYDSFDGRDTGATLLNSGTDKGRPVARIRLVIEPGESKTITVTMTSGPGAYGPLQVVTTPLVRATPLTQSEEGCTPAVPKP